MLLSFTLTQVSSWNGKWPAEGFEHVLVVNLGRTVRAAERGKALSGKNFYYNFGDGWTAQVSVSEVDAKEARRLRRTSDGFAGYGWMVDSILDRGEILPT